MKKELKHIAIILDGNRRWAKKYHMPAAKGHEKGFKKIADLLEWGIELKIKEFTLYCFSTENFKREKKEVDNLFNLFRKQFDSFSKEKVIHDNKVRINVIGNIHMFPKDMQNKMKDIMKKTKGYKNYRLNLALAYGGRSEIVDAVKHMLQDKKVNINKISENTIRKNLYLSDEPDLLIRPGGEQRLSNFLTWQS
ncbi:MAG: polyprenyl diphosphate synthase, partial [Nanoarchaeota archaeon]